MEKICLINNYNYAKYLGDSIESALAQTLPFDKIIVIDDGSSDESITIIKRYENNNPSVISILKKNQGQFSCFCAVVDLINEDSQVFFLDSDDIYPKDYLEKIMSEINYQIFDFTYCTAFQFFESNQKPSISSFGKEPSLLWEKTQAHVLKYSIWMGSPTSALSISGKLFKLLASYPHYEDWRIRADDIFVFGTSIIGAKKLYIPSLCVGWRIHGKNASVQNSFWKIKLSPQEEAERLAKLERFFNWVCNEVKVAREHDPLKLYIEYQNLCPRARFILKNEHGVSGKRKRRMITKYWMALFLNRTFIQPYQSLRRIFT